MDFRSYFDEFKGHDNVRLVILSRMNDESENSYKSFIESYLNGFAFSIILLTNSETKTSGDNVVLPMVKFINHFVPYSLLPALYSSADAFVLASHGEGWGLPLMEGMIVAFFRINASSNGHEEAYSWHELGRKLGLYDAL